MNIPKNDVEIWRFETKDSNRARLKTLISKYIGATETQIELETGEHGKPKLKSSKTNLKFNLSHSGDLTYYAFAHDFEVGIDVEKMRPDIKDTEIAERLFSKANQNLLCQAGPQRVDFFYKLWTFHESLLKARGESIFSAPKIAELIKFHSIDAEEISGQNFYIQKIEGPDGYRASVAGLANHFNISFKN